MRVWTHFLVVALFCGACSAVKISEQERFFKPSTNDSKVYIYTVQPAQTSASQQYLSALLLIHSANNALSINTFLYAYNGHTQHAHFTQLFTDSVQLLNESTFPINFIAADAHSATPSYYHSFKRDKIEFESDARTQALSAYEVLFSKQNPFQVMEAGTALEISGTRAIPAELHSLNGRTLDQESILHLHTMDSIESLFDHRKSARYYWVDFGLEEEFGTLFFRLSDSHEIDVLLNTFASLADLEISLLPSTDSNVPMCPIVLKSSGYACQILPFKTTSDASGPQQFWTGAVEIIDMSTQKRSGVGNIFVL